MLVREGLADTGTATQGTPAPGGGGSGGTLVLQTGATASLLGTIDVRGGSGGNVNGTLTVFSDDPAVGTLARLGSAPIGVLFQSADLDLLRGVDPAAAGQSCNFVGGFGAAAGEQGLVDDALPAFRFLILLDRSFGVSVQVDKVTVVVR